MCVDVCVCEQGLCLCVCVLACVWASVCVRLCVWYEWGCVCVDFVKCGCFDNMYTVP